MALRPLFKPSPRTQSVQVLARFVLRIVILVIFANLGSIGFARSLLAYELPDGRLNLIDGHLQQELHAGRVSRRPRYIIELVSVSALLDELLVKCRSSGRQVGWLGGPRLAKPIVDRENGDAQCFGTFPHKSGETRIAVQVTKRVQSATTGFDSRPGTCLAYGMPAG